MASLDNLKDELQDLQLEEPSEDSLNDKLQTLRKKLEKKQSFVEAVSSMKSFLVKHYSSASPSLQQSIYLVVCRVATILQTRYTALRFWLAGKGLFEEAERLVTESSQKGQLKACIAIACEHVEKEVTPLNVSERYLFEGHLTVDPEPPQPQWMVARKFHDGMIGVDEYFRGQRGDHGSVLLHGDDERVNCLQWRRMRETYKREDEGERKRKGKKEKQNRQWEPLQTNEFFSKKYFQDLEDAIIASLEDSVGLPRRPPASKDVVNKLPLITVTEEVLVRLGSEKECSVCRDDMSINEQVQELPCKHLYHPLCLKPWLDEHNSCPVCWYELPTDDHAYEGQKERDREAEEERKGAANALPGGEFMYI